jgi:hypothetical protein
MSASAVPQLPQNLVPGGFSAPHATQPGSSDAPQSPQNFLPVGLEIPQPGQSMVASVRTLAARHGDRARPSVWPNVRRLKDLSPYFSFSFAAK